MDVLINGRRDQEDLNLRLETISPFRGGQSWTRDSVALRGSTGSVPSDQATAELSPLTLNWFYEAQDDADAQRVKDRQDEALIGLLEVQLADALDRVRYCYATRTEGDVIGNRKFANNGKRGIRSTVTLMAYDAAQYDRHPMPILITSTPSVIPVGTRDSGGLLFLFGIVGSVIVTNVTPSGAIVGSFTLTGSTPTAGGEGWWVVDFWDQTISVFTYNNAVPTNGASLMTAGDWFPLSAGDADREANVFSTLAQSAGYGVYYGTRAF